MLNESFNVLDSLMMPNGLPKASSSSDYAYVWLRDSIYIALPYRLRSCNTYERIIHRWLDMFREYEWKLDIHTKQKPRYKHEYIHSRFSAHDIREIHDQEWGHVQHDAIGAFLWAVGEGERAGKKILRDKKDQEIIQKLVWYLSTCQYWIDADNGMWEEWRELHSSSVGACVAGLQSVRDLVFVPRELILNGYKSLSALFPNESADRPIDLAQMSLIYPYNILFGEDAKRIVKTVEDKLLRKRGVARYEGDSYYALNENEGRHHPLSHYYGKEAEWTFGLPWLALCHSKLGNKAEAQKYLKWTEDVMLDNAILPELYYAGTNKPNPNTPLGWSSAMYILAYEELNK